MNRSNKAPYGFSLLELSIVLVILAFILGGGLKIYDQYSTQTKIQETRDKMKFILQAVDDFYDSGYNGSNYSSAKIPSASRWDPDLKTSQDTDTLNSDISSTGLRAFGFSSSTVNGYDSFNCGTNIAKGYVPTYSLRIPPEYAFDAWGNRIMYMCTTDDSGNITEILQNYSTTTLSVFSTYPKNSPFYLNQPGKHKSIRVILISAGPNQKAAWMGRNATKKNNSNHSVENINMHWDYTGTVISPPTEGFDDIVAYITKEQMEAGNVVNPYFEDK